MKDNKKAILTICITTFNRGKKALNLLETILPHIGLNIEILMLNNNSDAETRYYDKIKKIAQNNKSIKYIKHDSNIFFHNNYLSCFLMATTKYIMILSDEDFPNMKVLESVLYYLLENPTLGIFRGSIRLKNGVLEGNALYNNNIYYKAGKDALCNYGLSNNYHSGTIYNREMIEKYGFIDLLKKNIDKYMIYPQLYIELLTSTKLDVYRTETVLSYVGPGQVTKENGVIINSTMLYKYPYSFGSRVDQFIDLRDAIYEVSNILNNPMDILVFIKLYTNLVIKYFNLISKVNMPLYKKTKLEKFHIIDSFYHTACASILDFHDIKNYHEDIIDIIDNIYYQTIKDNKK